MGKNLSLTKQTFFFCDGDSCRKKGGEEVVREARSFLRNNDLWASTHTIKTRCNGRCEDAPTCIVQEGGYWYKQLTPDKIIPILKSHINHDTPVKEYLLFQNGWNKVDSENELGQFKPKDFVKINDSDIGLCYITKGFSSDQYLFPLFQYLQKEKKGATLNLKNGASYSIENLTEVIYKDPFKLSLTFEHNKSVNLVIGAVPKSESEELIESKITSTEYYITTKGTHKEIRFKNRKGTLLAVIQLNPSTNSIWEYCLNIQLGRKADPTKENINV